MSIKKGRDFTKYRLRNINIASVKILSFLCEDVISAMSMYR